jgi:hypothetical protein
VRGCATRIEAFVDLQHAIKVGALIELIERCRCIMRGLADVTNGLREIVVDGRACGLVTNSPR